MLILYENIRKRREQLGISQQELAEAVGYKGKSMISQIENGNVDLSSSMISKIAAALNCTESYLMGWDDLSPEMKEEFKNLNSAYAMRILYDALPEEEQAKITEIEKQLVQLTPENRTLILNLLKSLLPDA